MTLTKMTSQEYAIWSPRSKKLYAADKMRAQHLSEAEALSVAEESFKRFLPEELHSKDNHLYTFKNERQEILGFIWFQVMSSPSNRHAFICDVIIEEEFRGVGLGKTMMRLIEKEVKNMGLDRIGLHVFGFNETAIRLYQSLGYSTVDLVMEKSIAGGL